MVANGLSIVRNSVVPIALSNSLFHVGLVVVNSQFRILCTDSKNAFRRRYHVIAGQVCICSNFTVFINSECVLCFGVQNIACVNIICIASLHDVIGAFAQIGKLNLTVRSHFVCAVSNCGICTIRIALSVQRKFNAVQTYCMCSIRASNALLFKSHIALCDAVLGVDRNIIHPDLIIGVCRFIFARTNTSHGNRNQERFCFLCDRLRQGGLHHQVQTNFQIVKFDHALVIRKQLSLVVDIFDSCLCDFRFQIFFCVRCCSCAILKTACDSNFFYCFSGQTIIIFHQFAGIQNLIYCKAYIFQRISSGGSSFTLSGWFRRKRCCH